MNKEKEFEEFKIVPHVHAQGEWIPMDHVEFVDISEDLQGYDLMTFVYEGKEYQSRIISKPF
jgi:hypothetical protein